LRDAATAARRIIQLPDARENPGAMLMRHIVWRMREQVGDGSATAAVIAHALAQEMQRVIAGGADALVVKRGIERALRVATGALKELAVPLEGEERIAAVATAATGDAEIGRLLGEIYDVLGPHANIVIVPYIAASYDRAYREGARFPGGYVSPYLLTDAARRRAVLEDAHVLVADMTFESAESAANLLELVAQAGGKSLLAICKQCSDRAVGVFATNNERGAILSSVATMQATGDARRGMVENIGILTGGKPLHDKMGMQPEEITFRDLGRARRAVVERESVTIVGGQGSRAAIGERMHKLRERARTAPDAEERDICRELLTHFSQGVAELRLGALTEQERARLTEAAEQAIKAIQAGMESGVVAGGGAAYLACIPAIRALQVEGDEAFGAQILARVLEEPMRRIAANAHVHPPLAIAEAQKQGVGYGLDARTGKIVDLFAEGIADPALVAQRALEHGVSGAMMLLTTDALVIHRKPKGSVEP
jgi:chaperonin GroEL